MCGINYEFRLTLYARDNYRCYLCGCKVKAGRKRKGVRLATLDHYLPRSAGGTNDAQNLKTCCSKCNNKKGSAIPKELSHLPQVIQ